ncbi:MAG: DUF87 domain-containing protein [Clostridia bacterium]|nr:DUF87 domain-containing protein [Clostridia bacterium]
MKKYYSEEQNPKAKKKSSLSLKLRILNVFMPYILSIFFSVFLFAFLGLLGNIKGFDVGYWITVVPKGLFSTLGTIFFMLALIYHAIVWKYDLKHKICIRRVICTIITMVLLSTLQHLIEFDHIILDTNSTVYGLFKLAVDEGQGGGIIGGLLAILINSALHRWLAIGAIFIALLFMILQMFNITPFSMIEALFKALGGKPKGEKEKKEKVVKEPKPKKGKKVSVYNDDGDAKEELLEATAKNHKPAYLDISKYINTDETIVNEQNTKYTSLDDQLVSSRGTASEQLQPYSDRYTQDENGFQVRKAPVVFDDDEEDDLTPQLRPTGQASVDTDDFDTSHLHTFGDSNEDTAYMTSVQDIKKVDLTPSFEFNASEKAYKFKQEEEDDDFDFEKNIVSISSFGHNGIGFGNEEESSDESYSNDELYTSEAHEERQSEHTIEPEVIEEDEEYEIIRIPKKNRQEFLANMQSSEPSEAESSSQDGEFGYLDKLIDNAKKPVDPNKTVELNGDFVDNSNCIPLGREGAKKVAPPPKKKLPKRHYKFPPVQFLQEPVDNSNTEQVKIELQENARIIVETLEEFKTKTRISDITRGPTVTRYELVPEAGVRVRTIAGLSDDIKLKLAAQDIRMECPVPGKGTIGIEVPNKVVSTVYIRDLIESPQFKKAKGKLTCALGKSIAGENIYVDIQKTPHLLVAGSTGMGKSVCINSLLVSLLYRTTPDDMRMILIDPKKVELSNYNGIPHLLVPVVVEPKKALGALQWAVTEMDNRFDIIEAAGVKNIDDFNEKVAAGKYDADKMPSIVIVIDELADLKMTVPDIEGHITRLTQKARAAGMHVIIGTQRPSVDVLTGLIKSNIPSRISFRVPSQIDSRTVLDEVGAEKLVSRGDMLVKIVGSLYPVRVQGAFVSTDEIEQVIQHWKETAPAIYDEEVMHQIDANAAKSAKGDKGSSAMFDGEDDGGDDELDAVFYEALEIAVESGKISSSYLQRRLRLGFQRAARLIDQMEECGYIGEANGSKPRDVLITKEDFQELMMRRQDS